jgi:hypothetical protein
MMSFTLTEGQYIVPTPAGAYHAVASPTPDATRNTLRHLLRQPKIQAFSEENLNSLMDGKFVNPNEFLEQIYRLQEMGLVQSHPEPREAVRGTVEKNIPELLALIAGKGKALLADNQGFYLGRHGFAHETAEELAGLSADLSALYLRHARLLNGNMGMSSSAWGLINAGGLSELSCYPLFVGEERFVLVLSNAPNLNQTAFLDLIWMLILRFGD